MEEKKFIRNTKVDIVEFVEQQDEMIRQAIHKIGGEEYEHITIDKNKILAALKKSVKKKVMRIDHKDSKRMEFDCPACRHLITIQEYCNRPVWSPNYCSKCGQALDWDLEVEDGQ